MSFALTVGLDRVGVYEVICTHCRESLGTMTTEMIARAIQLKGPILCPGCRLRHCDYCGRITKHRLPSTQGPFASGLYRICPLCVQGRRSMTLPEFEKKVTNHIKEIAFPEQITEVKSLLEESTCLSCSPKVHSLIPECVHEVSISTPVFPEVKGKEDWYCDDCGKKLFTEESEGENV